MKNKKGFSTAGWVEGILFVLLIVVAFGAVITSTNTDYNRNDNVPFLTDRTESSFKELQDSLGVGVEGGKAESQDTGINLKTSWKMTKLIFNTIMDFITGSWIKDLVFYMKIPLDTGVVTIIQTLYALSLFLIVLYIFLKVKP